MKKLALVSLALTLPLPGCHDDGGGSSAEKAVVDTSVLEDGVTVLLVGNIGAVDVAFTTPLPDVDDVELEAELDGAISLLVVNDDSGVSADLLSGTLVSGEPAAPGEYSWSLGSMRNNATILFFNETSSGSALRVGESYTATMQVATNEYIESIVAVSFQVEVQ